MSECKFQEIGEDCMWHDDGCYAPNDIKKKCGEVVEAHPIKKYRLELELDFVPTDEDDLTILQWLIADTIEAISKHYGIVHRIGRGWHKVQSFDTTARKE